MKKLKVKGNPKAQIHQKLLGKKEKGPKVNQRMINALTKKGIVFVLNMINEMKMLLINVVCWFRKTSQRDPSPENQMPASISYVGLCDIGML